MEQDTLIIRGDQSLPRTLYIAPWKRVGQTLQSTPLELEIGTETLPEERDLFIRKLQLQKNGYSIESSPASLPAAERAVGTGAPHQP